MQTFGYFIVLLDGIYYLLLLVLYNLYIESLFFFKRIKIENFKKKLEMNNDSIFQGLLIKRDKEIVKEKKPIHPQTGFCKGRLN